MRFASPGQSDVHNRPGVSRDVEGTDRAASHYIYGPRLPSPGVSGPTEAIHLGGHLQCDRPWDGCTRRPGLGEAIASARAAHWPGRASATLPAALCSGPSATSAGIGPVYFTGDL